MFEQVISEQKSTKITMATKSRENVLVRDNRSCGVVFPVSAVGPIYWEVGDIERKMERKVLS